MGLIRDALLLRVDDVRKLSLEGDNEAAHVEEKMIWHTALTAIKNRANGEEDPAVIAEAALRTSDIPFVRWFA